MGIRITGIETPLGGISWEHVEEQNHILSTPIMPSYKINVFISSKCGVAKYDDIREELKDLIESTKLANVYLFEGQEASTVPAGKHYIFALEDSDVCVFLIDNKDGVTPGVQAEINTVRKNNIKALYYFCDENSKEKTPLEQSLIGAVYAKSRTVHKFKDLSINGAQGLLDDIIGIYRHYCKGRLNFESISSEDEIKKIKISDTDKDAESFIPRFVVDQVDKCKNYILELTTGFSWESPFLISKGSSDIDEWCAQFLKIMFEGNTIRQFNTSAYLEILKNNQSEDQFKIVTVRWKAIQAYFLGSIEKCVDYLVEALQIAKESKQPSWIISDILIDLRNQNWDLSIQNNIIPQLKEQKELDNQTESVYYPLLDRLHKSIYEKYVDGFYKKYIESPYTISYGSDISQYGEMLASSFVVAMYYGSLTHILLFYKDIKRFLFYLCSINDNWKYRCDLYKYVILTGDIKEIHKVQDSYPEILNKLTSKEAASIINFCSINPVEFKRIEQKLRAFGAVGYFLDEKTFQKYQDEIYDDIQTWLNDDNCIVNIGYSIFPVLSDIAYRIPQDKLAEICCSFMDRHYSRWYFEMFDFIAGKIDLKKLSKSEAQSLISHICALLDDENGKIAVKNNPNFLCVLRKQDCTLTETLDRKIEEIFPTFYNSHYRFEVTEHAQEDWLEYIRDFIKHIRENNENQGVNGRYAIPGIRYLETIRNLLFSITSVFQDVNLANEIINVCSETLLSKERIHTKLDAVALLYSIIVKYPEVYSSNIESYESIFSAHDNIIENDFAMYTSNVDIISLNFGLQILYIAMGKDRYSEIIELLPYVSVNLATTISVENLLIKYLYASDNIRLPSQIETVILQNTLQWLRSNTTDIRWNATKILFALCRAPENITLINREIVHLIDSDNAYIKNLIMRNIYSTKGILKETRDYIVSKCQNDDNYIVRMVCSEVREKNSEYV